MTNWYATHSDTLQHTAKHCNTLQHTATHCNKLQHTAAHCNTLQHACLFAIRKAASIGSEEYILQHTATHCNTLQHTATHVMERCVVPVKNTYCHISSIRKPQNTTTHCNTHQHTAIHGNTLQHASSYEIGGAANIMFENLVLPLKFHEQSTTHCNTLQHTATHCNTLQHTATHCNTLQHASVYDIEWSASIKFEESTLPFDCYK